MPLSSHEMDLIPELQRELRRTEREDTRLSRYYHLQNRIEQLGMAIPPEMRRFLVVANWPRVVVDTLTARQQVRSLVLPGEEHADPVLRRIWDANNLESHFRMLATDAKIFGRAFLSIGTTNNPDLPRIRVEPPQSMAALVDVTTETMTACARFHRQPGRRGVQAITLYQPGLTKRVVRGRHGWEQIGDDERHDFPIPVVMHLHRRMSGAWAGESELTDIIPLTDSVARSLTNLQFAQEAHGIPRMWVTGVAQGDFVDANGKPVPLFEAYFDAIQMLTSEGAKIGQLDAADLKNFETALTVYGRQAATVTGFPARYFGLTTANPSSEGALNAEEAELVRHVEADNSQLGMSLGWAAALGYEFATGTPVLGNQVRVDWHDPATPTVAQRMDAVVKAKQSGILSREGAWDEMGWSEARKAKERAYFQREEDPELEAIASLTR